MTYDDQQNHYSHNPNLSSTLNTVELLTSPKSLSWEKFLIPRALKFIFYFEPGLIRFEKSENYYV